MPKNTRWSDVKADYFLGASLGVAAGVFSLIYRDTGEPVAIFVAIFLGLLSVYTLGIILRRLL